MTLADNLRRLRVSRKLTQEQLATETGLKQTAISRYEKGRSTPDLKSLLKLAAGLTVSLESLTEGVNVRFDLMYQGLQATFTTNGNGDAPADPNCGMPGAEPAASDTMPLEALLPGAPPEADTHEPQAYPDVAAAHAALRRITSELLAVSACLAPGAVSVPRDLGSEVRPRNARRRHRTRQSDASKAAPKRR